MTLTPATFTLADIEEAGACFDPVYDDRFDAYELTHDTEFNIFDVEQAYQQALISSMDLGWLSFTFGWFNESDGMHVILDKMAEYKGKAPGSFSYGDGIGAFDNDYANDIAGDRVLVDELFFRVVHELAEGQPLFNWDNSQ